MLIARLNEGFIEVAEHQEMYPDTSFSKTGPNEDFMAENGCMHVSLWRPYDHETEELVGSSPYVEDGQVFTVAVRPKQIIEPVNLNVQSFTTADISAL